MKNLKHDNPQKYNVNVEGHSFFLEKQSSIENKQYVFAYSIHIINKGTLTAKLLSRHWIITNGKLNVQEVRGSGVLGTQPIIEPNKTFEYQSSAVISTETGTMKGSYYMVAQDGHQFVVNIPSFALSASRTLH